MEAHREPVQGDAKVAEGDELIQRAEELLRDLRRFILQQGTFHEQDRLNRLETEVERELASLQTSNERTGSTTPREPPPPNTRFAQKPERSELQITSVQQLPGHPGRVASLTFSKTGRRLIAGTGLNQIWIWDRTESGTWRHSQTLEAERVNQSHRSYIIGVLALGFEDRFLVSGSDDKGVRIYQATMRGGFEETQQVIPSEYWHFEGGCGPLALSPNGSVLLHTLPSKPDRIFAFKVQDLATGFKASGGKQTLVSRLSSNGSSQRVSSMAFAPDGRLAVGLIGEVAICDMDKTNGTLGMVKTLPTDSNSPTKSLAWAPNSLHLAAAGGPRGRVRVWSQGAYEFQRVFETSVASDDISDVKFSPDGELLAVTGANGIMNIRKKANGSGYDWVSSVEVEEVGTRSIFTLAFHPGSRIIATGEDGVIKIRTLYN